MCDVYVIWSWEHEAWWGPSCWAYTTELAIAGRYTYGEAQAIVDRANLFSTVAQECLMTLEEAELWGPPADDAEQMVRHATRRRSTR
jgi:hypothetical protein